MSVYPRWRGEHYARIQEKNKKGGLSPLARGTLVEAVRGCGHIRFIPAGAGNTKSLPSPAGATAVYPRWRGEHTKYILLFSIAIFIK